MTKAAQTGPAFTGFPPETLKFLKALGFHQTREWFEANRDLYLSAFKEPLEAYVVALSGACAARKIDLRGEPGKSVFRLHRDVRFSKDKRPYKTNGGCVLTRTGGKGSPGLLYTHLSPEGCFLAVGFYHLDPEPLAAFRRAIAAKPAAFLALRKKLADAGLDFAEMEALKRDPKGFDEADVRVRPALRLKHFIVRRELPDAALLDGPRLVKTAADFAVEALPLLKFGWSALDRAPTS